MADYQEKASLSLEEVYASALLELAEKTGQSDAVAAEASELASLLRAQKPLRELLASRVLSTAERAASIDRLFKGNVSDLLLRFIRVVNDKGRLDRLAEMLEACGALIDRRAGILHAEAYVARTLSDADRDALAARLGEALGHTVVLSQHEDPSLIGGLKLRIGDRLIDGSVATQLKLIRQRIVREGRNQSRQHLESLFS